MNTRCATAGGGAEQTGRRALRTALGHVHHRRGPVLAVVLLGLGASLAEGVGITLFLPLLSGAVGDSGDNLPAQVLDRAFDGLHGDARLVVLAAAILGAAVVRSALALGRDALSARIYGRTTHELRTQLHDRLVAAEFGWLQRTDQGRLLNGLANETWNTADAVVAALTLLTTAATVVVYGALLLLLSWQLSIAVAVALLLMAALVRVVTRPIGPLSTTLTAANAGLATRMIEACSGGRVIRTFGREAEVRRRFDESSREVAALSQRMELLKALVNPVYEVLAAAVIVGLLLFALRDEQAGVATALVFLAVLYRLQPRVKELDANRVALLRLVGGVEEVRRLLAESRPARDGTTDATLLAAAFRFDHVTFGYEEGVRPALHDVVVDIPAGRTTALVGPSGAGKSTFVDLLLGLHEPNEGSVLMDGHPLSSLRASTYRRRMALVGQDTFLFNTTVRENIAFAEPEASDADLEEAARLAHADDFISCLPAGWDTVVGDDGLRLSGGQRQRIALARAVLRKPDLLVLDEATSALDAITERVVQDALDELADGRTVVVVAHRLSTIQRADHVVVLDGGRVVEQGRPAELAASEGGLFARMNRLQQPLAEVRP